MINIPIYRAKKIDSDEWVEGYLRKCVDYHIYTEDNTQLFRIDIETLSIHFPNMQDSQGNKIFASLSEDGIGGDNLNFLDNKGIDTECTTKMNIKDGIIFPFDGLAYNITKIIGIKYD